MKCFVSVGGEELKKELAGGKNGQKHPKRYECRMFYCNKKHFMGLREDKTSLQKRAQYFYKLT